MNEPAPSKHLIADPEEVVVIGNPESKPQRGLRSYFPSGGNTRRQAKARARLEKLMQNPNITDDVASGSAPLKQKLSRGQQKRADYKTRQLRQAGKQPENIDSK
jgi:hypothetical protein